MRRCISPGAVVLAAAAMVLGAGAVAAEKPPPYVRKATWFDTMLATREAMAAQARPAATRRPLPDFGRAHFAVMAWIRTRRGGTILAKAPAAGQWVPQGKALFVSRGKVVFDIGWVGAVTSRDQVADGKWHHVALVSRPGQQRIYVDGKLSATGDLRGQADAEGWVVKIGQAATNFGGDFHGRIDEVRVYSRAMSAADIKARFEGVAPAKEDGLVGYWRFEGDGEDASGSLNSASKMIRCRFAEGKAGKALELAGGGFAMIPVGGGAGPYAAVWAHLRRDFRDDASRREMAWEREDGIWDKWEPGDWSGLAKRYARASHRLATVARELAAGAGGVRDRAALEAIREGYLRSRRHAEALRALAEYKLPPLRAAIESLRHGEGRKYPNGERHLARLDALETEGIRLAEKPGALAKWAGELAELRRRALIADNPLLSFDKLLFVKRYTYRSSHYYTDFIDGCAKFGGNLCVLDRSTGRVTELVPALRDGIFGRFDLSFDAKRVVFDWKPCTEKGFRIYEVGIDLSAGRPSGRGLRQLTFEPADEQQRIRRYDNSHLGGTSRWYNHHTDDMHPCYLPDGGIVFTSTRCEYGTLCDAPDKLSTAVLYRMDGDGKNIEKLTNSSVSEFSPSMMPDGRVLYARWEYVDKGQIGVKCLWAMRPDGTGSVEIFGNNHAFPPTLVHGRTIPRRSDLLVVLGTPHYPQSGVGTVIRLDVNRPARTRRPMTYITPNVDIRTEGGFHHRIDGRWVRNANGPLYMDPYPLSESFFLVSCNPDKRWNNARAYGLYLLDEFGNRVLIHKDPEFSCWQPVPLRPRPKPPVLPRAHSRRSGRPGVATVVMSNVYEGLEGVQRGTIKYLRVMEQVPRPWSARRFWDLPCRYNHHTQLISAGSVLGLKVLHGIVPVYADGSANFTVPADRNIYLQALDGDFMEVQRMRTYENFRPGEVRSCVGCHESRQTAPGYNRPVAALRHPPSKPGPQPGEVAPRAIHYPVDVQPILDRHCVRCHSGREPKARLDLSGEMTKLFTRSYESLIRRGLIKTFDEGSDWGGIAATPPRTVGSHASRLITVLRKGHNKVKLSRAEMIRLTTWVDANGQYYGSYYGRRNIRYKDHPDFRPVPTFAQAVSTTWPAPDGKPRAGKAQR